MKHVMQFLQDETGQDLVEYALIVAAIGLALMATLGLMGHAVENVYQRMIGQLTGVDWSHIDLNQSQK